MTGPAGTDVGIDRPFAPSERFLPVSFLGRGASGLVYRVHDVELGMDVALKTLWGRGPDHVYWMKAEFRSLAGLAHPNLVELYELFVDELECFFTMELVDGVDFVSWARGLGSADAPGCTSTEPRFIEAVRHVTDALAALHRAGKLHRDVKPSNVLVTPAGRGVVLDFGLVVDDALAGASQGMGGTWPYMAPEASLGARPAPAGDWYSLGVLLYEALAGNLPYEGSVQRVLREKQLGARNPCDVAPGIAPAMGELIARLLDPDPGRRPGPGAIRAVLDGGRAVVPVDARPSRVLGPFVGRETELGVLARGLNRSRRGTPNVVAVSGPSGIGKTELVQRFVDRVRREDDALVLRGRCHPLETVSYKAFDAVIDGLSRYLLGLPDEVLATLVPPGGGILSRLFPVLARVPALASATGGQPDDAAEVVWRRGVEALRELLRRLSTDQPLVVWIDDLQWGDLDSLGLLREVLRVPGAPAVCFVLSYRTAIAATNPVLERVDEVVADLPAASRCALVLAPLELSEATELASLLCGADHEAAAAPIAAASGGSPFFLRELARLATADDAPGAAAELGVGGVETLVADRLERLAAPARQVLEVVAVAGRPVDRRVVLQAAHVPDRGFPLLLQLERRSLLRAATSAGLRRVEVYHDRIREAVVDGLSGDRRRQCHLDLAEALAAQPDADPLDLFTHYGEAGVADRAGRYAEVAADRAAAALAFELAAALYRSALELQGASADRLSLERRRAEALANGGFPAEAGALFETVAERIATETPAAAEVEALRRQAAEQYLRGGQVERGSELIRAVLAAHGVWVPRSGPGAWLRSLGARARLFVRGTRFTPRQPAEVAPAVLARLDAYWVGAYALGFLDPIVADGIGARFLFEALAVGEESRVQWAIAYEATQEASLGRLFRRRVERLLALSAQLATGTGARYDRVQHQRAVGMAAYFLGDWPAAAVACDDAVRLCRDGCPGATWEAVTLEAFCVTALAQMGRLPELLPRWSAAMADADTRGDAYAAACFRMGIPALAWLVQDRAEHGREMAEAAVARWPATPFLVQHYLHLIATVQADLYLGDPWRAWRRLSTAWPRLRRAQILVVAITRAELHGLRARVALAAASAPAGARGDVVPPDPAWPKARLLAQAAADARRVDRVGLPAARAVARFLRAGVAAVGGEVEAAVAALQAAQDGFAATHMGLHAAAARWLACRLRGGAEGARQSAEALAWLHGGQVVAPQSLLRVYCPTVGPD